MKRIVIILILILLSTACIIEDGGFTESFLINQSNHSIKVVPYLNGTVQVDAIELVNPYEKLSVFHLHQRGKITKPSYADILIAYDSVKLIYDDQYAVKHLKTVAQAPHEISFVNNRNLVNVKNYEFVLDKETKHTIANHYNFTFTEQDYLDAKQ